MNTTFEKFLALLDPNNPYLFSTVFLFDILKIMILVGFGIYIIFAFVVVRQIQIMTRTITTGLKIPVTMLGLIHLGFALAVWLFAFVSL